MTTATDAYLLDAVRTPFGRSRGALSGIRADDLAALPIRALVARHPALDPAAIADVILGDANGAGEDNRNVARMAALLAGLPTSVPGVTVNRLCGSGAEAIASAARSVAAGEGPIVAGGAESMSRAPFVVPPIDAALPRTLELVPTTVGWRMPNPAFPAAWTEALGRRAEVVAAELGIDRAAQDAWAVRSHRLAAAAQGVGAPAPLARERAAARGILTVEGLFQDEGIRPDATLETLDGLRPAFSPDGTVTAGNASPISDGAVATLVGSAAHAESLGVQPLARIAGSAVVGVDPGSFPIAPVAAIRRLLERLGRRMDEVAVLEINEAFAAVVLSCLALLPEVDPERVNPAGGAIAVGHPVGASAARAVVDCARNVRERGGGLGIMAACIGVGQGIAVAVEA